MTEGMLKAKFLGSLIGTAVGDAVGAGFEGKPAVETEAIESLISSREILNYTDDTHMMIGMVESLVQRGGFDGENMARTFMRNYDSEPWRGYGAGPPSVFRMIRSGEPWNKAAERLYIGGSYGNGSAMRIAPVGLFYHDDLPMLKEIAYRSSRITHSHELGTEGAALQAYVIAKAVSLEPTKDFDSRRFLAELYEFVQFEVYKRKLGKVGALLGAADRGTVVADIGNGVEAFSSVPTAIYSFLLHHNSFEDAVLFAVSLGGDTDTIAAMTGAICGAYLGVESIPDKWRSKLENREYIAELAEVLYDIWLAKPRAKSV